MQAYDGMGMLLFLREARMTSNVPNPLVDLMA